MGIPAVFTFADGDLDGICTAQTTAGAGALAIDGALLDLPATMRGVTRALIGGGFQRTVSLKCTADIHTVNVTIVGTDINGAAITETRAAPTSNTVFTTAEFATVTSVTVDAAVGTAMQVGSGTTGTSRWYKFSLWNAGATAHLAVDVAGTINFTGQQTSDDVDTDTSPNAIAIAALTTKTADTDTDLTTFPRAVRVIVNSSTVAAGSLTFTILPQP